MLSRQDIAATVADLLTQLDLRWDTSMPESAHLFDDLGMDSFDAYEMIEMVELEFNLDAPDDEFAGVFTVADLIEVVVTSLAE